MTGTDSVTRFLLVNGYALLIGFAIFLAVMLVLVRLRSILAEHQFLKSTRFGGIMSGLIARVHLAALALLALWCALLPFEIGERFQLVVSRIALVIIVLQFARWADELFGMWLDRVISQNANDDRLRSTQGLARVLARAVIWITAILVILDNVGVEITTLVAGLGIGGIAIALAVQNILGDLFASLSIVLDRPFVIGDFIVAGAERGTVEYIGIKTTRIRSLTGEQIVISNADLMRSRIQNFKRMTERRVGFNLSVTYETPLDRVREIPRIIEQTISQDSRLRFDRAHFKEHGDSGLIFEVVYFVKDPDMRANMDSRQDINLKIHEAFAQQGIEFAYPTQKLFVAKVSGAD